MQILKIILVTIVVIVFVIGVIGVFILNMPQFGKKPKGIIVQRIEQSVNFKDGQFVNQSETKMMSDDASYFSLMGEFLFPKGPKEPQKPLNAVKPDFNQIPKDTSTVIWFGHSSLFLKIANKNILVDPVFSPRASPFQFAGSKNFSGTDIYDIHDFPAIDYVIITHDHYDHLDYETVLQFKNTATRFITPLGVGAHLEHWGINPEYITQLDWWENVTFSQINIIATPGRHFSGRGIFDRNQTLWASYVLQSPDAKIFLGGDSGYDHHFKEIGIKYGPFDLALLESGQYHNYWKFIHMMPEETVQAAKDLNAKMMIPIHWGKFTLALHQWDEPIERVLAKASELDLKVRTPMIGEPVRFKSENYTNKAWWRQVQ